MENSFTRNLLQRQDFELYSPEFSLVEIKKYQHVLCKKAGIDITEFVSLREELAIMVHFIPLHFYSNKLKSAHLISPDPNDVDFFALALLYGIPLWSNDRMLKHQTTIQVITTEELIEDMSE